MDKLFGLDFGTTNSSIAIMKHNTILGIPIPYNFSVEPNEKLDAVMKSLVHIDKNGITYTGNEAGRFAFNSTGGYTFRSVKKLLGEKKNFRVGGKFYTPTNVVALIIKTLVDRARAHTTENVNGAVIGVPVGFSDLQKVDLLDATIQAGLVKNAKEAEERIIFIAEPVAVALSYGLEIKKKQKVLVFDFGGGTLDLTIMDMNQVRLKEMEPSDVLAKSGALLGGDDIDEIILKNIIMSKYGENRLLKELKISSLDEIKTKPAGFKLMEEVESKKIALSLHDRVKLEFFLNGLDIVQEIQRNELEIALIDILARINVLVNDTVKEAKLAPKDIDMVLMAGGSSLIPAVKRILINIFGPEKVRIHDNPLTSISQGLAIAGGFIQNRRTHNDITDFDYGLWDAKHKRVATIIEAGTCYTNTAFDLENEKGIFKIFKATSSKSNYIDLEVFQKDERREKKLHSIRIPVTPGPVDVNRFKIYFTIDDKKGWLSVKVYDLFEAEWIEPPTGSDVRLNW